MKKIVQYGSVTGLFVLLSSPVFAEAVAREDNSMTLVYFFLGVCGLIILLQMIPVFALAFGILKGIFGTKNPDVKPLSVRHH